MTYERLKILHNLLIDVKISINEKRPAAARMGIRKARKYLTRGSLVCTELTKADTRLKNGNRSLAAENVSSALLLVNIDKKRTKNAENYKSFS